MFNEAIMSGGGGGSGACYTMRKTENGNFLEHTFSFPQTGTGLLKVYYSSYWTSIVNPDVGTYIKKNSTQIGFYKAQNNGVTAEGNGTISFIMEISGNLGDTITLITNHAYNSQGTYACTLVFNTDEIEEITLN